MTETKLARNLQAARIPIPEHHYIFVCIIAAACSSILWTILWVCADLVHLTDIFSAIPKPVLFLAFTLAIPAGVYMFTYFIPSITASGRRSKINLDLPYAITYMQALSTTLPLYEIFKSVYASDDLYGEVSKECGLIVRDVELFGADLITAIENTRNTTPSEKFSELLNDLLIVYRSGGDIRTFFNAKSDTYREVAKTELDSSMQFLEIIAEVYVTLFVAGPIALMIMLVAQSLSGQITIGNLMPIMFIGLPVGAIMIISVLYLLLPQNNLSIAKKEIRGSEFSPDIVGVGQGTVPPAFVKKLEQKRVVNRMKSIARHPAMYYSSNYSVSCVLSLILALVTFLMWQSGFLPVLLHSSSLYLLICLEIIAVMLPVAVAYEIRSRYVSRVEKQLPEFLREISDMRDIGMTLQGAIQLIARSKSGVLSSELKLVSKELDYGSSLSTALVRMENRVGITNVKRAISLLVRASEVTDYIREILAIAVGDLNHYLQMKNKRFNASFAYVAIVYISFAIFLFTAYVIFGPFIASFSTFNVSFNLAGSVQDMFIVALMLATFSGIMSGQMAANSPLAGLKHSIIMLIGTVIMFIYVI